MRRLALIFALAISSTGRADTEDAGDTFAAPTLMDGQNAIANGLTVGDVDYFKFTELTPRHLYTAETSGFDPATDVAIFQMGSPEVVVTSDDGPRVDRVSDMLPFDGYLVLAVTRHGDVDAATGVPTGAHAATGEYWIRVFDQASPWADVDASGLVDLGDLFDITRIAYGDSPRGDADHDFDTDGNDFITWQRQLGRQTPAVVAVPEPGTASLMAVALLAVVRRGQR